MGVWSTQPYTPTDKNKKNDDSGVDVPVISDEMYIVNKVWDFAMQLAEKANVEWRIVIAKSGNMSVIELDGKSSLHDMDDTNIFQRGLLIYTPPCIQTCKHLCMFLY